MMILPGDSWYASNHNYQKLKMARLSSYSDEYGHQKLIIVIVSSGDAETIFVSPNHIRCNKVGHLWTMYITLPVYNHSKIVINHVHHFTCL